MKMLSPWFVALVAFGCGGAQPVPEEAPVRVAAVEAPSEPAKAQPASTASVTDTERAAAIVKALSELDVNTLGALGPNDTVGALSAGEVPLGVLDGSARGVDAVVRQGGGGLAGGPAPAPREQLTGLYTAGRTQIGPVRVSKGTFSDPDGQVSRHRALFANCYRQERRGNPTHMGTLDVEFDVNPSGRVEGVRTATRRGLHASVARCVEQGATNLQFDLPPTGVTLTFVVEFDP
jgi:outer membrane biosynthesis protein TonB